MSAFVSVRNGPFRDISRPLVRQWAQRMLRCLDLGKAELSVALTDDGEIRELNRVFRHRDRATDVLAFAMREGEPVGARDGAKAKPIAEMLGDVVISVETARRQAARRRRPLDAEMRVLLAHGLLHLVGYDHQTKSEAVKMFAETRKLCRAATSVRNSGSKSGTSTRAAKPTKAR